jgi:hypothetical protein
MELSTYALHEEAALALCRGGHETRKNSRCLDAGDRGYVLTSVSRRLAPAPGRAIGKKGVIKCRNDRACGSTLPKSE